MTTEAALTLGTLDHILADALKRIAELEHRVQELEATPVCICGEINARHCPVHNEAPSPCPERPS